MPTQLFSILASASLIMSFPAHCLSYQVCSIALPFYSIQSHLVTILNLATAFQRVSFPLPYKSGRHFAVTFLNLSSRHFSIANHFFAIAIISHPWLFLTPLLPCSSMLCHSVANLGPCFSLLSNAFCYAIRFYSLALPVPCFEFQLYSIPLRLRPCYCTTSSQVKAPFPEFRHCPKPFRMP